MSDDIGEILPRLGLRRTVPRLLILAILREAATHLSAISLHELVTSTHGSVNPSTMYRNVAVLTEHGVLHSIEYAGETLFGLATVPHHHLICRRCGRLFELPASHSTEVTAAVMTCSGFEVHPRRLPRHGTRASSAGWSGSRRPTRSTCPGTSCPCCPPPRARRGGSPRTREPARRSGCTAAEGGGWPRC
ncbi:transcriptional repressor [Nonomuraea sp. C10]|nr:transcriptional repressor [Nonomuraea sp. C10]